MSGAEPCGCGAMPTLIYSCSGAADTGEISDRAARALSRQGVGKMSCLAGVGGRVGGLLASAQGAEDVLLIDGCPQDCARKTMELAGLMKFRHLRVTDAGLEKGRSPATAERVEGVVERAKALLRRPPGGEGRDVLCHP